MSEDAKKVYESLTDFTKLLEEYSIRTHSASIDVTSSDISPYMADISIVGSIGGISGLLHDFRNYRDGYEEWLKMKELLDESESFKREYEKHVLKKSLKGK